MEVKTIEGIEHKHSKSSSANTNKSAVASENQMVAESDPCPAHKNPLRKRSRSRHNNQNTTVEDNEPITTQTDTKPDYQNAFEQPIENNIEEHSKSKRSRSCRANTETKPTELTVAAENERSRISSDNQERMTDIKDRNKEEISQSSDAELTKSNSHNEKDSISNQAKENPTEQSTSESPLKVNGQSDNVESIQESTMTSTEQSTIVENKQETFTADITLVEPPPEMAGIIIQCSKSDVGKIDEIERNAVVAEPADLQVLCTLPVPKIELNVTPQLMDESIISVPDSPLTANVSNIPPKDSTFSPVVDTSIQDSRPTIDVFDTLAVKRNVTLRTSTPLAQRLMKRDAPKHFTPILPSLATIPSPRIGKKADEKNSDDTFSGQLKMINPLEKSILKSTRRKRSMSLAEGESFMHSSKKVMFISPQVMEIRKIDEKMMASFIEEKENSMMKACASGSRRKRSMSVTEMTKIKSTAEKVPMRSKMPNFKAIHENQFKKMESLVDVVQRNAERLKKVTTPTKHVPAAAKSSESVVTSSSNSRVPSNNHSSRIPLMKKTVNVNKVSARLASRSQSAHAAPVSHKRSNEEKSSTAVQPTLKRSLSEHVPGVWSAPTVTVKGLLGTSKVTVNRSKVDERRNKNISLFKGNAISVAVHDQRKKNENILAGVRQNRRFELMMKYRDAHQN